MINIIYTEPSVFVAMKSNSLWSLYPFVPHSTVVAWLFFKYRLYVGGGQGGFSTPRASICTMPEKYEAGGKAIVSSCYVFLLIMFCGRRPPFVSKQVINIVHVKWAPLRRRQLGRTSWYK